MTQSALALIPANIIHKVKIKKRADVVNERQVSTYQIFYSIMKVKTCLNIVYKFLPFILYKFMKYKLILLIYKTIKNFYDFLYNTKYYFDIFEWNTKDGFHILFHIISFGDYIYFVQYDENKIFKSIHCHGFKSEKDTLKVNRSSYSSVGRALGC